jgi:hypothetical protein
MMIRRRLPFSADDKARSRPLRIVPDEIVLTIYFPDVQQMKKHDGAQRGDDNQCTVLFIPY